MGEENKTGIAILTTEDLSNEIENISGSTKKIMWSMVEYKELQMVYSCAIKEIQTKFDILNTEFKIKYSRNPISHINSRLKSNTSVAGKLKRKGLSPSVENIVEHIKDFAGVRVVCSYIDDIYTIADSLLMQSDIKLIERKDYIKNPKPNGYRSLHLIVSVPVFFAESKKDVTVEVQIRTIAMDFWASLEHQMKYKQSIEDEDLICRELKECAEVIAKTDEKMQQLRIRIQSADDIDTEDEILFDRLRKIDTPI